MSVLSFNFIKISKLLKLNLKIIKFSVPIDTSMRKILFVVFLFFACSNPDNHGDLSIFKTPTTDQFDKWSNIDSVYKSTIEMVDVYKKSGKLNFNGNPWDNKKFQSKYSDLTWRGYMITTSILLKFIMIWGLKKEKYY